MLLLYNTKWTQCSSSHKASLFFNTKRDAICPLNENSLISATLSPAMDSGHVYPQEFTILVVWVPCNTHRDFSFNFKQTWDKKIQALSSHLEQMKVTWENRFIHSDANHLVNLHIIHTRHIESFFNVLIS